MTSHSKGTPPSHRCQVEGEGFLNQQKGEYTCSYTCRRSPAQCPLQQDGTIPQAETGILLDASGRPIYGPAGHAEVTQRVITTRQGLRVECLRRQAGKN